MPLDHPIAFARDRGLLVIEDCAQAYVGSAFTGHPDADVSMFSFGPIKTNTALQGALLRFRDPELLRRVRQVEAGYPVQPVSRFARRLLKYSGLKALNDPTVFSLFAALCRLTRRSHDQVISAALRGFPGPGLLPKIRHQPSAPLLALLHRKLTSYEGRRIANRTAAAHQLLAAMPSVETPGRAAAAHSFWTFPVTSRAPDELMRRLWRHGFDATRGASSLSVVHGAGAALEPQQAEATMENLLYLPSPQTLPTPELRRLGAIVAEFEAGAEAAVPPLSATDPASAALMT
jgi:dTDP-4-amino-4,6-dideoxygalactose transaminase